VDGEESVDQFMDACGATGPIRLSVDEAGRPNPTAHAFDRPFLVIGRSPAADLVLDHPGVSRRHAYLQLIDDRLLCVDLSPRGVLWEDGATNTGWLDPGRSARIGPFTVARRDLGDTPAPAEAARSPRGIIVELIDSSQGPPVRAYRIKQLLSIIGRSASCHIPIEGPEVSHAHCSLVETAEGIWAVDLLGKGGISVNGEPVRSARVGEGDVLRVGPQLLRFRLNPSKADPSTALATRSRRGAPAPTTRLTAVTPTDAQTELVQAMMAPLIRQFGLMQQQMFDQFHQAMMAMFESIGGAYRDQMDDLRDELEEVRRITRELQAIQAETEARPDDLPPDRRLPAVADPAAPLPRRPPPTRSDAGVHGVLMDRIARLQDERQTRWQKILAKVSRPPG
jgi:pSer/pThr/pTyr-binding forkhead associated (FHA) protein